MQNTCSHPPASNETCIAEPRCFDVSLWNLIVEGLDSGTSQTGHSYLGKDGHEGDTGGEI